MFAIFIPVADLCFSLASELLLHQTLFILDFIQEQYTCKRSEDQMNNIDTVLTHVIKAVLANTGDWKNPC